MNRDIGLSATTRFRRTALLQVRLLVSTAPNERCLMKPTIVAFLTGQQYIQVAVPYTTDYTFKLTTNVRTRDTVEGRIYRETGHLF